VDVTLAARAHPLSPVVHAVEPPGALCGARPSKGRWRRTTRLPINCPRCLLALGRPRFAVCQTPSSVGPHRHLRRVGPEGITSGRDRAVGLVTLCGAVVGWDVSPVREAHKTDPYVCPVCRKELKR
jgi:hypothetical protein